MSAETRTEISLIRDEDLLKKMWQDTEDFGKKKEIRAHMYKLREARLKDLYADDDYGTKSFGRSSHADSLADHSFASLKSKEIRDSESPIRDVADKRWNVSELDERSIDGKTRRLVRQAQTGGTEVVPGGKIDYEAKIRREATDFRDGDDNNYVTSKGGSSETFVRQEAAGGDDNTKYKTFSTSTSSSSHKVTEHKSSYDSPRETTTTIRRDDSSTCSPNQQSTKQTNNRSTIEYSINQGDVVDKVTKVYTENAPNELKSHPGYVEGRTKVTRETTTLSDGTVVTTTKYETSGINESNSSSDRRQQDERTYRRHQGESNVTSNREQEAQRTYQRSSNDTRSTIDIRQQNKTINQRCQEETNITTDQNHYDLKTQRKQSVTDRRQQEETTHDDRRKHEEAQTTPKSRYYVEKTHTISGNNVVLERDRATVDTTSTRDNAIRKEEIKVPDSVPLGTPIEIEIKMNSPSTEGRYDTTYRSDYTNKKISVETSATHNAFARSLRAVSPTSTDRPTSRHLKTSNSSLRSSSSPEKQIKRSPDKFSSTETITYKNPSRYSPEKKLHKVEQTTDLDDVTITTKSTKKVTGRSSSSSVVEENRKKLPADRPLKRTDTYEERCRQILGITDDKSTKRRGSSDGIRRRGSDVDRKLSSENAEKKTFRTERKEMINERPTTSNKTTSPLKEFPAQMRKTPEKNQSNITRPTMKPTVTKEPSPLQEYPAQIRRSRERSPVSKGYAQPTKNSERRQSNISEFPSQIKNSDKTTKSEVYEITITNGYSGTDDESKSTQTRKSPQNTRSVPQNRTSPQKVTRKLTQENIEVKTKIKEDVLQTSSKQRPQNDIFVESIKIEVSTESKQNRDDNKRTASILKTNENKTKTQSKNLSSSKSQPSRAKPKDSEPFVIETMKRDNVSSTSIKLSDKKDTKVDIEETCSIYDKTEKYQKQFSSDKPEDSQLTSPVCDIPATVKRTDQIQQKDLSPIKQQPRNFEPIRTTDEKQQYIIEETCTIYDKPKMKRDSYPKEQGTSLMTSSKLSEKKDTKVKIEETCSIYDKPKKLDSQPTAPIYDIPAKRPHDKTPKTSTIYDTVRNEQSIKLEETTTNIQLKDSSPIEQQPTDVIPVQDEIEGTFSIYDRSIEQRDSYPKNLEGSSPLLLKLNEKKDTKVEIEETCSIYDKPKSYQPQKPAAPVYDRTSAERIPRKTTTTIFDTPKNVQPRKVEEVAPKYPAKPEFEGIYDIPRTVQPMKTNGKDTNLNGIQKTKAIDIIEIEGASKTVIPKQGESPQRLQRKEEQTISTKKSMHVDEIRSTNTTKVNKKCESDVDEFAVQKQPKKPGERKEIEEIKSKLEKPEGLLPKKLHQTTNIEREDINVKTEAKFEEVLEDLQPKKAPVTEGNIYDTPRTIQSKKPGGPSLVKPQPTKPTERKDFNVDDVVEVEKTSTYHTPKNISLKKSPEKFQSINSTQRKEIHREKRPSVNSTVDVEEVVDVQETFTTIYDTPKQVRPIKPHGSSPVSTHLTERKDIYVEDDILRTKQPKRPEQSKRQPTKHNDVDERCTVSTKPKAVSSITQKKEIYPEKRQSLKPNVDVEEIIDVQETFTTIYDVPKQVQPVRPHGSSPGPTKPIGKRDNYAVDDTPKTKQLQKSEQPKRQANKLDDRRVSSRKQIGNTRNYQDRITTTHTVQNVTTVSNQEPTKGKLPTKSKPSQISKPFGKSPVTPTVKLENISLNKENQKNKKVVTQKTTEVLKKTIPRPQRPNEIKSNHTTQTIEIHENIVKPKQIKSHPTSRETVRSVDSKITRTTATTRKNDLNQTVTTSKQTPNLKSQRIIESSSDESGVDEQHEKKYVEENYEGRMPVEEPLIIKKTASLLYSDDEDDVKSTQMLIENEIVGKNQQSQKATAPKSSNTFITNEKIPNKPEDQIPTRKTTLMDIEKYNGVKEHQATHIRTNRVDESVNKKKVSKPEPKSPNLKKHVVTDSEDDDESIPDSLDDFVQSAKKKTKTNVVITNADLQRSISSREPSPDKVCPLPVTSEDDGSAPRYPDEVVEPDEHTNRKKQRLTNTIIQEDREGIDSLNIQDVTRRVSEIDRVDKDDESLLTVDKKINRFLATAEKLIDKTIVDISQPAPKVERPKLEVGDDLKEDECLLSVSDKVTKFIAEAEQLTSKPKKKTTTLDQDVFITTERAQLEKEVETPIHPTPKKEKVILSSVGRLRSNESIQKAKEVFETKDILNRPSVFDVKAKKTIVNRNNVTPKRLDFSSDKPVKSIGSSSESEIAKPNRRSCSPEKYVSKFAKTFGNQIQSSVKHSIRKSLPDDEVPGYMKPLDRSISPDRNSNLEDETRHRLSRRKFSDDDIPGYMKPLDRSVSPDHSSKMDDETQQRPSRKRVTEDEIPGYMKPLDRSISPDCSSKMDVGTKQRTSRKRVTGDEIPGYMKPLDRSVSPDCNSKVENDTNQQSSRRRVTGDEIPGYMKPLDRSVSPDCSTKVEEHTRRKLPQDEIPGYMKPLDRDVSPEWTLTAVEEKQNRITTRKFVTEDDTSGYMKPLGRQERPGSPERVSINKTKLVEEKKQRFEQRQCSATKLSSDKNTPSYMKPLNRAVSPERSIIAVEEKEDRFISKKIVNEDDTPRYMKPLERQKSPERLDSNKTKLVEEKKQRFEHRSNKSTPSYMKPLDRSVSPERIVSTVEETENRLNSRKSVTDDDTPGYMKPLKHQERPDSVERVHANNTKMVEEKKQRFEHRSDKNLVRSTSPEKSPKPSRKDLPEQKVPGYIKQLNQGTTSSTKIVERTTSQKVINEPNTPSYTKPLERKQSEIKAKSSNTDLSFQSKTQKETTQSTTFGVTLKRTDSNKKVQTSNSKKHSILTKRKVTEEDVQEIYDLEVLEELLLKVVDTEIRKKIRTQIRIVKQLIAEDKLEVTIRNSSRTNSSKRPTDILQESSTKIQKSTTVKKQTTVQQEVRATDVITSSYGVGPTDETGAPLFGLRALRAQNATGHTKVQGVVMTGEYYEETGREPVGQISVTKYSTDPRDLGLDEESNVTSVTTNQKFGKTDDRRTVTRKNSVKALTEKLVSGGDRKTERQPTYPKAGLILRSSSFKNESSSDDAETTQTVEQVSTRVVSGGTFLRNKSKVTGVKEAIVRMRNEDVEVGDTAEDVEAKNLLNRYIGSQVILSELEGSNRKSTSSSERSISKVTTVIMENGRQVEKTRVFEHPLSEETLETIWDEQTLRYLLEQGTDYEERKRIRSRLRQVMAEQEACTELVKQATSEEERQQRGSIDESTESTSTTSSRRIVADGAVTTTKVTTRVSATQQSSKKPLSPFAKFRQLDKQNSLNTPPSTPRTPGGGSPLFQFTDAALSQSASTIKDRLLHWCRTKTKEYENIQLDNFSSSWADGLAFCALIHHFLPDAFDYHALTSNERRHNFTLAFKVADEKADIAPLLDVDDMVATRRPDWKCVFTYVQSIYRRFKDED